jgi:hypothetical protein
VQAVDLAGNRSPWSASPSDFELDNTAPSVNLTSPLGGEVWTGSRNITWTTSDPNPSTADLEISTDSGVTWSSLAYAVTDSGTWSWDTTSLDASPFLRVRVRATDLLGNVSSWSSSAADFKILHWSWLRATGSTSVDRGFSLALDSSGNAYYGGHFVGTVNFRSDWGGAQDTRISNGSDGFVVKVNADGSYGWVKCMGGSGVEWVDGLATDASGNLYVAGKFSGTVDFRADWGGGTDSKTASGDDGFVMKINADGSYGWTKILGGPNYDCLTGVAVDGSGAVYVSGYFSGSANFAADWSGTDSKTAGNNDGFVTKINADGTYGWTHSVGGTSSDSASGVAADAAGNVYLTGYFLGSVNFESDWSGTDSRTSLGTDAYLLKILPDGSYGWVRSLGGAGGDVGNAVIVDGQGNVYLSGYFEGTVDFQSDWAGTPDNKTSAGATDGFIVRVDANGSYGWTRVFGGTGSDQCTSMAVDGSGRLYLAGLFSGTVDFRADWGGSPDQKTGNLSADICLLKLDTAGAYGWSMIMGGSSNELTGDMAIDGAGNLVFCGTFRSTVDFRADWGGGTESRNSVSGSSDIFVLKLR